MVRLKDFYETCEKVEQLAFQFLMVRLKENLHQQCYWGFGYFNSLWCDNIETGKTGRLGA